MARRDRRQAPRSPSGVERLGPEALRWTCPPADLRPAFARDAELAAAEARDLEAAVDDPVRRRRLLERRRLSDRPAVALEEVVGQPRAIEALLTGLSTEAPGFHVFVVGPPGTGREALVRAAVRRALPPLPPPRDHLYVANFQHPDRPRLISLPRGQGRRFRRDVDDMLAVLRRSIPHALDDERHLARCDRLRRRHEEQAVRHLDDLAARLHTEGLIVGPLPEGFGTPDLRVDPGPQPGGAEPLPLATVERRLRAGELRRTKALLARLAAYPAAQAALEQAAGEARAIARKGTLAVRRLEAKRVRAIARGFAQDLARSYPSEQVRRWTRSLLEAIGERLDDFLAAAAHDRDQHPFGGHGPPPRHDDPSRDEERRPEHDPLALFRANLFVDAKERPAPPVLFEPNPTYQNLFGSLDADSSAPDHLRLRAGSLLRANGGVLVVDAAELLQDPLAWRALKRAVRSGWIEVQRAANQGGGAALRPAAIRTAFKLVAIGTDELWGHTLAGDPDALEVFKVKAQLEDELPRTPGAVQELAGALLRTARRAGLRPPDAPAVARLLERSARLAGRSDRLAPRLAELLDVLQEADRLAAAARARRIGAAHVERALEQRRRRVDLDERRLQELIDDGLVLLDLDGARTGVVNALVVYVGQEHAFGRPCRVSAAVGVGRRGVVDIEREADLSGESHHKGVQILQGLLLERYAQDKPLALTATLCFEQSYAEVDGDSASLAEALAVLSALGDLPLDQGWAVTGSINQKGELQPIGDASEKVEGFFDVCRARGLTGRQGVVLPRTNVRDLMLREDVVAAVAAGRFHVATAATLDDALELLTGVPAGARPAPGAPYPDGTGHARVDARLRAYADVVQRDPARG